LHKKSHLLVKEGGSFHPLR